MEQLTPQAISTIDKVRHDFEDRFNTQLINDSFRNIVTKAIPLENNENEKVNNPEFREKFGAVLSNVSKELVDNFHQVGSFDTGSLFTSMVTSITDSVSLESAYRTKLIENDIMLGRVKQDQASLDIACEAMFGDTVDFKNKDVKKNFIHNIQFVLSTEDAGDIIDRIKNDVKSAIEETEAKNELVEGTTQEITDYKNEIAPPDDQYYDPENPNDVQAVQDGTEPNSADPNVPENDVSTSGDDNIAPVAGDDNLGGDDTGVDTDTDVDTNQVYETPEEEGSLGDDGLGNSETSNGEDDLTSPMANAAVAEATGDGSEEPQIDTNLDDNGEDGAGTVPGNDKPVGGDDGVIDQGDVGKDMGDPDMASGGDMGMDDPNAMVPAPSPETQATPSGGTTNTNSGGVTINIQVPPQAATPIPTAQNPEAPTESWRAGLNLFTSESFGEKEIPVHPKSFESFTIPDVNVLASEALNIMDATKLHDVVETRFDALKYAIKRDALMSDESKAACEEKRSQYGKVFGDAINQSKAFSKAMSDCGISAHGLTRVTESTLCIARNIINRFIKKSQHVSIFPKPYTSKENVISNAFDIVQLRKVIATQESPDPEMVNDLFSRENVFYHNIVNVATPELKKEATAVIDLSLLNFRKAMSPNFITDYKIKSWELNVGDKSNFEINAEVKKRVSEKFEKIWGRKLNEEENAIIAAACNQDDVTEIVPTPYEKFMVSMTKESMGLDRSGESGNTISSLTSAEASSIRWKSKIMTTAYKAAERFGLFRKEVNDIDKFIKFNNIVGGV